MNQAGVRTEKLWFNFTPERVHWARFAGKNFTDRNCSGGQNSTFIPGVRNGC
jgi:hypothetical protein